VARVEAEDPDLARRRMEQVEDAANRRRLSRPVRADEAEDFARPHGQVDAPHGLDLSVALREPFDDEWGCRGFHLSLNSSQVAYFLPGKRHSPPQDVQARAPLTPVEGPIDAAA
jgi:hypothetical protein